MRTQEVPGTRRCRRHRRRHVPGNAMQHPFPGHCNVDDNFRGNSGVMVVADWRALTEFSKLLQETKHYIATPRVG